MTLNNSFAGKLAGWGLLVVLGLNLRPILSSISPLLGEIRLATGLWPDEAKYSSGIWK